MIYFIRNSLKNVEVIFSGRSGSCACVKWTPSVTLAFLALLWAYDMALC